MFTAIMDKKLLVGKTTENSEDQKSLITCTRNGVEQDRPSDSCVLNQPVNTLTAESSSKFYSLPFEQQTAITELSQEIISNGIACDSSHYYGLLGHIPQWQNVPVRFGDSVLMTSILRSEHTIFKVGSEKKILKPYSPTPIKQIRRNQSTPRIRPQPKVLDDHFEEAMRMFPPNEELADIPELMDRRPTYYDSDSDTDFDSELDFEYDEETSVYQTEDGPQVFTIYDSDSDDEYEPHSGFSFIDSFAGNKQETSKRIEAKLTLADQIKQECDSITQAEIQLEAIVFRDKLDRIQNRPDDFVPQDGSDDPTSIDYWLDRLAGVGAKMSDYSRILSSAEADTVIKHITKLVLLFIQLQETRSYRGAIACILGYLEGMTSESLFNILREYITNCLCMEAQDGFEFGDDGTPGWLNGFRQVTKNWKTVSKMPAWRYIQRILSLAVSAGMCKAADINFTVGEMQMFTLKIEEKQATAFDLLDAILATSDYFVEAGFEAYQTRSIRPFFFDNQTARILDDAYVKIAASMKALATGDLDKTEYTSEQELAHVLENTLSGYNILRQQSKYPTEKRTLEARVMKLEEWRLEFIQTTVAGGLREAPYSIYLIGDPGIGKSMMTQVLVEVVLQANGVTYEQKQIATVNPGDKFASTVKNDTLVVVLDDFGNFVLEFENENPLKYIIEICNNVVSYVPKAEAHEKGRIGWRPKLVITTSNIADLLFAKLSNAPDSARRRGIRMRPRLKEEFATFGRFDEDKYRSVHGDLPAVADAYSIDIEEWGVKRWQPMRFANGREAKDLSYADALEFHVENSREHFKKQRNYVKNHGSIKDQINICTHGKVRSTCHMCKHDDYEETVSVSHEWSQEKFDDACDTVMEAHVGVEFVRNMCFRWLLGRIFSWFAPFRVSFTDWLGRLENDRLRTINERLHYFSLFGVYDWLPNCVVETEYFERYLMLVNAPQMMLQYWQLLVFFLGSFSLFLLGPSIGGAVNGLLVWPSLFHCATVTHAKVITEFRDRRGALPEEFTASRDKFLKYVAGAAVLLTGIMVAFKIYRSTRVMEAQGNIQPKSMKDIHERDSESSDWTKVEVEPLPSSRRSECITFEQLEAKVKKNTVYVSYVDDDGKSRYTNGFFVDSNLCLIPYHILEKDLKEYRFDRRGQHVRGAQFKELLNFDSAVIHPEYDMALVKCCNTAPFEDLSDYLALKMAADLPFKLFHQDKDGDFKIGSGRTEMTTVSNGVRKFFGLKYTMRDLDTFRGMCMAPLVAQVKAPQVVGFHIGGRTGTGVGCAVPVTRGIWLDMRRQYFKDHPSALDHISEGEVFDTHYGVEWYEGPQIHQKSPLNFLPDECNIRYFGSCKGRATYYSEVIPTPIAEKVTEVCGHEQEYTGPAFHRWKSWYESLVYSSQPAIGCDTELLDWAVEDYKNQLWKVFSVDGIMDEVKKLTEIEIVSGKDGIRFVDQMPPNTSCGYPLGGPKRGKLIYLEPNEEHSCPRTFATGIWEEYRRMKGALRNGQRYYPMFKACLKDEPTKAGKTKVRVFQAAPLSLQLGVREYFLPIARVMSLFPLISECAVGINCTGVEWDELQAHIKKFGIDRIVAGDYSKYDLRMSAKLTSAAFKILIDFAEYCGYSEEDLAIMRGLATEIIYPMVAYNGDVVMLQGSNPSGQNLTVYINSIVNSLLNRIGFRTIYPDFEGTFCEAVALATYGDDFKSSASDEFPKFDHLTLAKALADIDMKITMPDKEADPVPFMDDEDCDFLKRMNRFHEVGYYVGALDEDSIFKSLKAVLRSKFNTPAEQAAQNIDGALREWFLHGKDTYELRRAQVVEIAKDAGIDHMCRTLDHTFEDKMDIWNRKYNPDEESMDIVDDVEETEFEAHSGVEHDLCDWMNCTYPEYPNECVYNNCSPPLEVLQFQAAMWKLYSFPIVIYFMFLIAIGRTRFRTANLTTFQRLILFTTLFLEGLTPWLEILKMHVFLTAFGAFCIDLLNGNF